MISLLFLLLILAIVLWCIYVYNLLVKQRNQVKEGWSGIDVQLKRRHNLIPNLVDTVKAYTGHEARVFEDVTELRTRSNNTKDIEEKAQLESALSMGLSKLIAIAENYPDLKANENFIHLQQELSAIEDQIQMARRYYNGATRDYNTSIESFPQIIIANLFQFEPYEYFEVDDQIEREVPKVNFDKENSSNH